MPSAVSGDEMDQKVTIDFAGTATATTVLHFQRNPPAMIEKSPQDSPLHSTTWTMMIPSLPPKPAHSTTKAPSDSAGTTPATTNPLLATNSKKSKKMSQSLHHHSNPKTNQPSVSSWAATRKDLSATRPATILQEHHHITHHPTAQLHPPFPTLGPTANPALSLAFMRKVQPAMSLAAHSLPPLMTMKRKKIPAWTHTS